MYISLYRKYRPKNFKEVVNQEHIKITLVNALISEKISHAYLFSGPRGIGKTSIARILAKAVNCVGRKEKEADPCGKCEICQQIAQDKCLDLIEIDAASTRGIDEIRELREKIKFTPTKAKYKVFIIDEVHMLTSEAFNALLKTLEEPPEHAIFVLVTTEPHKIPVTIISRCQRFDFKKLSQYEVVKHLTDVAKKEKVKIEKDALKLIAYNSEGCIRDSLSLLGQVISFEENDIKLADVRSILGLTDLSVVIDLVDFLVKKDATGAIRLVNQVVNNGYDLKQFIKNLLEYLRKILLIKINKELTQFSEIYLTKDQLQKTIKQGEVFNELEIIKIIGLFIKAQKNINSTNLPQLPIEMAIVEGCKE